MVPRRRLRQNFHRTTPISLLFFCSGLLVKGAKKKHEEFIKAIGHFGVTPILGNFKKKPGYCKTCGENGQPTKKNKVM